MWMMPGLQSKALSRQLCKVINYYLPDLGMMGMGGMGKHIIVLV